MPKLNPKHNKKHNIKRNVKYNKKKHLNSYSQKNTNQIPQKNSMKSYNLKKNNNFQIRNDYGMSADGFDDGNLNQIELLKDILLGRLQSDNIGKSLLNQNEETYINDNDILEKFNNEENLNRYLNLVKT